MINFSNFIVDDICVFKLSFKFPLGISTELIITLVINIVFVQL